MYAWTHFDIFVHALPVYCNAVAGTGRYAQPSSSEESSADPYSTVKVCDGGDRWVGGCLWYTGQQQVHSATCKQGFGAEL